MIGPAGPVLPSAHVRVPVLGLGGSASKAEQVRDRDQLEAVADNVTGGVIDECGHFPSDEQPEDLVRRLAEFFARF
jgi:pimeloyl-ACP methyl ester carboxylesterase